MTVLALALYSCDDICIQENTEDGIRRTIKTYPKCSDTGSYSLQITLNGKLFMTGQFTAGKEEGEFNQYDTSSTKITETSIYKNGALEKKSAFNNGILHWETYYKNDQTEKFITYYPNGKVKSEYNYVNMKVQNPGIRYDTLHTRKYVGSFYSGIINDTVLVQNGNSGGYDTIIVPNETVQHGVWIVYDDKGIVVDSVLYDKGKVVGKE